MISNKNQKYACGGTLNPSRPFAWRYEYVEIIMKRLITCFCLVLLVGCTSLPEGYSTVGKPTRNKHCPDYSGISSGYYGGDGSSSKEAIEIVGYGLSSDAWVNSNYPGSKISITEIIIDNSTGLRYSLVSFETPEGVSKEVWFWLSGGFQCF